MQSVRDLLLSSPTCRPRSSSVGTLWIHWRLTPYTALPRGEYEHAEARWHATSSPLAQSWRPNHAAEKPPQRVRPHEWDTLDCQGIGQPSHGGYHSDRKSCGPSSPDRTSEYDILRWISAICSQTASVPIKLASAMSLSKAQGQTFGLMGVYLPNPCFSHGQLYVAMFRVGKESGVRISTDMAETSSIFTGNPVWLQLLLWHDASFLPFYLELCYLACHSNLQRLWRWHDIFWIPPLLLFEICFGQK